MLELAKGLTAGQLDAIAGLESRVVAVDGGRLKLEWGDLRRRSSDWVRDCLWWEDGRLVGFVGIYGFGWPTAEIAGMVDPEARRRGIATALLDAALPVCREQSPREVLLVVPRNAGGGSEFAVGRGGELEHSEYALVQHGAPPAGEPDPRITMRPAAAEDLAELAAIFQDGFGSSDTEPAATLQTKRSSTLMIERDRAPIGAIRLRLDDEVGRVHGFVVRTPWRGQGIGRDVLRRSCVSLRDRGATSVSLEVEVTNERALGLYTSLGFERFAVEDYYRLPE